MKDAKRILWVVPEQHGGIRSYSEVLWPEVACVVQKHGLQPLDPVWDLSLEAIESAKPDLIHLQHEFGLFGSKIPGLYRFPKWVAELRRKLPHAKVIATAHTVLDEHYRYPVSGRGIQTPARWIVNQAVLPFFRPFWMKLTWGALDATVVHSELQVGTVRAAGCPVVEAIPHFVPELRISSGERDPATLLVFGFFSPEKGQDVVIRALRHLGPEVNLILAGGVRRPEDRGYERMCRELISELGLSDRVTITGYLSLEEIQKFYDRATLVIAPFRETSGSGSLVQAFSRGAPVLASDLPLNLEIAKRVPGSLAFFRSENSEECARKIQDLLSRGQDRAELSKAALEYARLYSVPRIAQSHGDFYRKVLG